MGGKSWRLWARLSCVAVLLAALHTGGCALHRTFRYTDDGPYYEHPAVPNRIRENATPQVAVVTRMAAPDPVGASQQAVPAVTPSAGQHAAAQKNDAILKNWQTQSALDNLRQLQGVRAHSFRDDQGTTYQYYLIPVPSQTGGVPALFPIVLGADDALLSWGVLETRALLNGLTAQKSQGLTGDKPAEDNTPAEQAAQNKAQP